MRQRILGSHTPPCHRRMVIKGARGGGGERVRKFKKGSPCKTIYGTFWLNSVVWLVARTILPPPLAVASLCVLHKQIRPVLSVSCLPCFFGSGTLGTMLAKISQRSTHLPQVVSEGKSLCKMQHHGLHLSKIKPLKLDSGRPNVNANLPQIWVDSDTAENFDTAEGWVKHSLTRLLVVAACIAR